MHLQTHTKTSKPHRKARQSKRLFLVLIPLLILLGLQAPMAAPQAFAQEPVVDPAANPTEEPAADPATAEPTQEATTEPTDEITADPTQEATAAPTQEATAEPTAAPTQEATEEPAQEATADPTDESTVDPPQEATVAPTQAATEEPAQEATSEPTVEATVEPTPTITATAEITSTTTITATPELTFQVAAAPLYQVNLTVQEVGGGSISDFTYLVNEDNAGDPSNPPSLKPQASHSPIVAAGNGSGGAATLSLPDIAGTDLDKFLISVRAQGYKLWGQHVSFDQADGDDPSTKNVTIELIPEPLPRSRIRVHVFHDDAPVNGEDDIPVESGLAGFHIVVEDTVGEVTVDWDGNPLCGGYCITDANGDVTIDNLPYGKYEVLAIPPDGSDWVQTTTIEGTHVIDAWIEEGNDGNSPREGFQQATVWVGFVQPMDNWNGPESGVIKGTVKYVIEWTPPINPLTLGDPVYKPWIALTDIGGNDQQVYLARGNEDGSFQIDNVPDGEYQMAIWDEDLDAIISFRTVTLTGGQTVDLGEFGIPRWFGWLSGHVFRDDNGDGIKDAGEPGMNNTDLAMRFRDGTVRYGTFTNESGFYEFPEVFELEKFYVAEVGFGRFARTSASVHNEFDPDQIESTHDGVLTLNTLQWAAKRSVVDWGKRDYAPGENGGISGIVFYAVTRNEFNARLALNEDYEPGIPGVILRLWGLGDDGLPNTTDDVLLNEVETDSWEHPTGCDALDSTGAPLPDPLNLGPNCIEVPNISNEVKDGVFDGGYAFETDFDDNPLPPGDYVVEVVTPPYYQILKEEDQNTDEGNEFLPAFPPPACVGDLHLVSDSRNPYDGENMPLCNKKLVTLQDQQNAAADFFLFPDSDPDQDATTWNWSTSEVVPTAGRIYGFLLDDLNIETDPGLIYYGEKRGIPNTSVGIRDYTGRLITMLTTDQNGIFEVILPSTYTANCPIPSGICPGMYRVIGNDPGDPDNPSPNFNPNYQTITFVFDVWPGKTTYADVALFPITAFTAFPGSQFGQPAQCILPTDQPQVFVVNPPYGNPGGAFTIAGTGFGATQGSGTVTINGAPLTVTGWSDTSLNVTIPPGFAAGPGQLLVTAGNGKVSQTGITFHVGVTPDFTVDPGESIQAAIDAASPGDLIVLTPGLHFGSINLNKAVTLQGYGPGQNDGFGTGGSVLDQRFIVDPIGINVAGAAPGQFTAALKPQIDGFRISNARDEQDVGGGLHVDVNGEYLVISNNVIQSNGGNFGGGITLGQPYLGDNNNDNIRIHHNRILNNGGFSLAGGIGIFNGADDYEIDHNEICGNYSGEYGGGISHFGLSRRGHIHHNLIYFNNAFDEGGGILIGGELPQPPATFTTGAGEVDIDHNLLQGNMSNDDGGGVRLLQPLDFEINITNNMIVNNVSTDFGGGIALDDASEVTIVNNTIARNVNTSTSEDANGRHHLPNGAGIAVETYSTGFEAYLGIGDGGYVDPVMFNNIICGNQAYIWDGTNLLFHSIFDLQVFAGDPGQELHPTRSLLTDPNDMAQEDFITHPTNLTCGSLASLFPSSYEVELTAVPFRMEPDFITVIMVTAPQPITLQGDYHTLAAAPAVNTGAAVDPLGSGATAPCDDFDGDGRPNGAAHDIGADEQPGVAPCSAQADLLYFSTEGSTTIPGVLSPDDDADIYKWNGTSFSRIFDASSVSLPGNADIDALLVVDEDTFYMSFENGTTTAPAPVGNVQDEDIVKFDAGVWSLYFDGSTAGVGLNGGSEDVDAFVILSDNSLIISTEGNVSVPGLGGTHNDEDLLRCVPSGAPISTCTWTKVLDGSDVGLSAGSEDVDGVDVSADNNIYLSTRGGFSVTSLSGAGEDVFICNGPFTLTSGVITGCASFSMFFDGSVPGVTDNLDALDVVPGATVPPPANLAPVVEAGPDLAITLPSGANLAGTVGDDGLPAVPGVVTMLWTPISGPGIPGSVSFTNANSTTTTANFSGPGVYVLQLAANDSLLSASDTLTVTVNPAAGGLIPAAQFYLSLLNNGAAGSLPDVRDEDIIGFTGADFIMVFDGTDVGVGGLDIDAFYIAGSDTILMSFDTGTTLTGVGAVDDSDIVKFTGTSFGETTAGSFTPFFDGSAFGLTTNGEDIDAVEFDDGKLLISTGGNISVPGASGNDEDLLAFEPTTPGDFNTGLGNWSVYFDGSDIDLSAGGEDVDGAAVAANGNIYLTTTGNFNTGAVSGSEEDIFVCETPTTGLTTACASSSLFFDGSAFGLGGNNLDAIELP